MTLRRGWMPREPVDQPLGRAGPLGDQLCRQLGELRVGGDAFEHRQHEAGRSHLCRGDHARPRSSRNSSAVSLAGPPRSSSDRARHRLVVAGDRDVDRGLEDAGLRAEQQLHRRHGDVRRSRDRPHGRGRVPRFEKPPGRRLDHTEARAACLGLPVRRAVGPNNTALPGSHADHYWIWLSHSQLNRSGRCSASCRDQFTP